MTVFKTFLKVLNKCKMPIIIYSVFLVFFGGFNIATGESSTNFTASKPDVMIINEDIESKITKNLVSYIEKNSIIKDIDNDEDAIADALFYRDLNFIIYIPENFGKDFREGKNPSLKIEKTGDYQSSLAEMTLKKYLKVANAYREVFQDEDVLLEKIDEVLQNEIEVEVTSGLDTTSLDKACTYYNFTNYCLLAGAIYVICLVLSSFKDINIHKRTVISSTNYKKINRELLLSNSLFAFALWLIYVILSFVLVGKIMFSMHGLFYIINSFVFTFCSLTIAFALGNIVTNKDVVNGIVNVIALGSSFLCGAFVPMSMLPESVLNFAHILPSYWFISSNETIKLLEEFNFVTLEPVFTNMAVIILFSCFFIVLTNIVSSKKRKLD